jgi:hypothetical protein
VHHITSAIQYSIGKWSMASLNALTQRTVIDKISLIAIEILMLDQAHFCHDEKQVIYQSH